MNTYAERLQYAMTRANVKTAGLARALDVSYTAVAKVLTGKSNGFATENNFKAAEYLGCDPHWLATGQGQPDQKPIRNTPTLGSAVVVLPHLNKDEAGMFERYLNGELEPQKSPEVWAMPSFFEGVPVFALTIEDDVMEPLIPKGSQVIIGVGVPHQSGDKVFIREGSSWLIRRLLVDGDLLYIDSPRTPSRPLTGELVGPVVSVNMPTMNLEERMKNK